MNQFLKIGITFGTIAGASGFGYGIYHSIKSTSSYSKLFKDALLSTDENDNLKKNWENRFINLKRDTNLVKDLKELKEESEANAWKKLRKWCKDIINNSSKGAESEEYLNIQNYCTYSIKEKITNFVDDLNGDSNYSKWDKAYEKLQTIDDKELDQELIEAKARKDGTKNEGVKRWCNRAYAQPYKGENDKNFKNASRVCLSE